MAFSILNSSRSFSSSAINMAIKNVTVIGSGLMGSGIAQVAAQTGHDVTLVDVSDEVLGHAMSNIKKSLQRVAKKKFADKPNEGEKLISETLARIKTNTSATDAAKQTDIVIEAIVENLEIKQQLFKDLDSVAVGSTIFTSNTSSLSITDISLKVAATRQEKFGGLHFFNPVPVMKLLEACSDLLL